MTTKKESDTRFLSRTVCRIHSTEHDFLTDENLIQFQAKASNEIIQCVLYDFRDHIKMAEGKDVLVEFTISYPMFTRIAPNSQRVLRREGQTSIFVSGQVTQKGDDGFFIESAVNLEVECSETDDCVQCEIGDWVEVQGELICWWNKEDILPRRKSFAQTLSIVSSAISKLLTSFRQKVR